MQWYEILVIVLAAGFVLGVIVWRIIRRKQGKGGCDCGCSNCSGSCPACKPKEKDKEEDK